MYDQLKQLSEQVQKLATTLDQRVDNIEIEQKRQQESQLITHTGNLPGEYRQGVDSLNTEMSQKLAEFRELLAIQKEQALAPQRPQTRGPFSEQKATETLAFEKAIRRGEEALTLEEKQLISFAFMDQGMMSPEKKTMVSAAADLGGFFAGTDFSNKFVQKLLLVSPMRQLADIQRISGEKLLLPSEGATDTSVTWSDEQSGYQASPDPTLGMIEIYARELNGYLKLSRQNLEDSAFDIENFILKRLSRQFVKKEGEAFITGNGIARPEGILTNTLVSYVASGTANVITGDSIVNAMHTVKSGYRKTGTWIMSNKTIGVLRLFKDTQNRPLWIPFGDDFRETLYGRPIVEMPDMEDPQAGVSTYTTSSYPIVFGDFAQAYQIVDRLGLTFQSLKEIFALQNQVAYLARMRVGGKVVLPEAIVKLKTAVS